MFDRQQAPAAGQRRAKQARSAVPARDEPALTAPAPPHTAPAPAPVAADRLSQTLGHAVAARVSQLAGGSLAAPAIVGRAGTGLLQRTPETEMTADPEGFFGTRIVSLDYSEGLRLRAPTLQNLTDRGAFVKALGDFNRHWFRLVPNPARTKEAVPAYILTPAIERYVQAFPTHRLLAPLVGNPLLPAVEGEDAYLRAAYVPYLTKKASDPETDVGHVDVRISRSEDEFTPDFVFTAAMNGCAFTVTGSADEDSFTAWHYQSPDSNREEASRFRIEKSPSDWFGAEEYDSGAHAGLFEVTNILWRPPGQNGWKVLSQEVDASAYDANDAHIRSVRSRDLVLGRGSEVDYTRRIYKAMARTQLLDIEKRINNTRARFVVDPEPKTFTSLETAVRALIAREEHELDAARDLEGLAAAALRIKAAREEALEVQMLANSIAKMAHRRVEADVAKFKFRQDPEMQGTLGRRVADMGNILSILAKTTWLDELAAEAAGRPAADEEPAVEAAAVAAHTYTIPDLKLIPRPPVGFYVPQAVVTLLESGLIRVGQIFTLNGRDFRVRRNVDTGELALWFALRGG